MAPITPLPEKPNLLAKNSKTKKRINKTKVPFPTESDTGKSEMNEPLGETIIREPENVNPWARMGRKN